MLSDAAAERVRQQVLSYLETRPDLAAAEIGSHTVMAASTCRHFLSGELAGGQDKTAAEFARVLRLAQAGDILPAGARAVEITEAHEARPARIRKARDTYQTETVRCVSKTLTYCAEYGLIGVITGDYGVGKTHAVELWRRSAGRDLESVCFEFDSFSSSNRVDFIESLAELLEVEFARGHHNGGRTLRAVCRKLQSAPCLVVLDQCEAVKPAVMQVVRQIWDHTRDAGVGMVLLAAPVLMSRLQSGKIADLGALSSRVAIWTQLRGISAAEMATIVKKEHIERVDEDAFRLWHRAVSGSMRRLMASVQMIQAQHAGRIVTEKTVTGVASMLWGMSIGARAIATAEGARYRSGENLSNAQ